MLINKPENTMITAQDLQKVVAILDELSEINLGDPGAAAAIGRLNIQARFAAIPLKVELGQIKVFVQKNICEEVA